MSDSTTPTATTTDALSDSIKESAPVFTVTDTSSYAHREGSLAWAVAQANAYTGEATPIIAIDASLAGVTLQSNLRLNLTRNVEIRNDGDTPAGISTTIALSEGVTATMSGISISNIILGDDATAVMNGTTIVGDLYVTPTSLVRGTVHFAEGASLSLDHWKRSTATIPSVLAGAVWTSDTPLNITLNGNTRLNDFTPYTGKLLLAKLSEEYGPYIIHNILMLKYGSLVVQDGVDICIKGYLSVDGTLTFEGNNVVSSADGSTNYLTVDAPDVVYANGTRFEVMVKLTGEGAISGEGIVFASETPVCIICREWDAKAASLQTILESVLSKCSYTIESPILKVSIYGISQDIVFNEETKALMIPEGYSDISFNVLDSNARTITVAKGQELNAEYIYLSGGGSLILQGGSTLTNLSRTGTHIELRAGSHLAATGATLVGVTIAADDEDERSYGFLTGCDMRNACLDVNDKSILTLIDCDLTDAKIYGYHGTVDLIACDLTNATIDSDGVTFSLAGCNLTGASLDVETLVSKGKKVDLSGNYWGTTNLEEIKTMITGYDEAYVTIGEVLTEDPLTTGAPVLTPGEVSMQKLGKGVTTVTLSWEAPADCTYKVYVDGKLMSSGKKTSWKGKLADGDHSYTVVATNAAGLSSCMAGELLCEATAPTLRLNELKVTKTSTAGHGEVTLSWESSEDATYSVLLDKKEVYKGDDTSCTRTLADGKYSYILSAVDAFGNTSSTKAVKFTVDTTAPTLTLRETKLKKAGDGQAKATLSWTGEKKATYILTLNGREVYRGTKASCKLTLADGTHTYKVEALDAAGNSSVSESSFSVDTIAPVVKFASPTVTKVGNGKIDATFSWEGEEGATYLLKVDGKKYSLTGTSYTLSGIKDGKHKYELTATDAAGNTVKVVKDSFTCDATAPKLSLKAPKLKETADGLVQASFSWKGEKGATYTLTLNDKTYDMGSSTKQTLTLEGGSYSYSVTAVDAAGNSTVQSSSFSYGSAARTVTALDYELGVSAGQLELGERCGTDAVHATTGDLALNATLEEKQNSLGTLA